MTSGPFLIADDNHQFTNPFESHLRNTAAQYLQLPAVSVMDKERMPPSGDKHDWMNLADYCWPNPDAADGLPYISRDGEANPEAALYDRRRFNQLVVAVLRLTAAFKMDDNPSYGRRAAALLQHWFLNPETAMRPHLRYAHHVPGAVDGRKDGLIVFASALPSLLDMWLLLRQEGIISGIDADAMNQWCEQFLHWLLSDQMSLDHAGCENNHGSYHDLLVVSLKLFLGQWDDAKKEIERAVRQRTAAQIADNGEQPMEINRTLSAQYSLYNLKALMSLARLGEAVGVDVWRRDDRHAPLLRATTFLYEHAVAQTWSHQQIEEPNWWFLSPLCSVANRVYHWDFDAAAIPLKVADDAVPVEPVVFTPGWELIFAPSHQQHLPLNMGDEAST